MKKFILIFMVFVIVMLTGCTSPVKDDLINYINVKLPPITHLEKSALEEYQLITKEENYSYEGLYNSLKDTIIPNYSAFVYELQNITLSTTEVNELNSQYLKGAEKQLEAFIKFKEGIEKKDKNIVSNASLLIQEAKDYMHVYQTRLIELAKEHGLKYKLE